MEVIKAVFKEAFPGIDSVMFRGRTKDWARDPAWGLEGKQAFMYSVVKQIEEEKGEQLRKDEVVLIDDDLKNCRLACEGGILAFAYQVEFDKSLRPDPKVSTPFPSELELVRSLRRVLC